MFNGKVGYKGPPQPLIDEIMGCTEILIMHDSELRVGGWEITGLLKVNLSWRLNESTERAVTREVGSRFQNLTTRTGKVQTWTLQNFDLSSLAALAE